MADPNRFLSHNLHLFSISLDSIISVVPSTHAQQLCTTILNWEVLWSIGRTLRLGPSEWPSDPVTKLLIGCMFTGENRSQSWGRGEEAIAPNKNTETRVSFYPPPHKKTMPERTKMYRFASTSCTSTGHVAVCILYTAENIFDNSVTVDVAHLRPRFEFAWYKWH